MPRSTDRVRASPIVLAVGIAALAVALALPAPSPTTPGTETIGLGASGALGAALGAPPVTSGAHRFAIRPPRTVGTSGVVRVRFAGLGTPGAVVVVHYGSSGNERVAEIEPGSSAVGPTGRFAFTAALPELPRGADRASWSARLIDPASLAVLGRVEGVHLVEHTER
ncbi:hypothetical protein DEJ21_10445 [Curtobacterium sp. MCSS17_006]|uniref:hypothetical protein n=1 Tax=Curtobacterium sp. MCSS17_006 TaxID=2175642 RepID=UPI000DA87641|nr:hypothetical protein [Curtobacterium sp. MCSS17_006]PZE35566.1 hypothetical protein DEJ21_10445 [Curtobacterium sp. MCSS17_006]